MNDRKDTRNTESTGDIKSIRNTEHTENTSSTAHTHGETLESTVRDWFFTFMCMNIPIIGWIYLARLASGKHEKYGNDRRSFAQAYLFYKMVFLVAAIVILAIGFVIGFEVLEWLLDYMEML